VLYLVYTIHVVVCVFLILVVLLQQGKGADLSVFGGGSTQTAFGARGAATLLHKLTVVSFIIFIVTTMSIAFLQGGAKKASVMGKVMEEEQKEQTAPIAPEAPKKSSEAGQQAPAESAPSAPAPASTNAQPGAQPPAEAAPPPAPPASQSPPASAPSPQ
jgi:preprotein translocase subunit SecG